MLLNAEALARATGAQEETDEDSTIELLENHNFGENSKKAKQLKQIVLKRNLASGLGNVAYREPSALLSQQVAIKQLLELSRFDDNEVVYTTSVALLNLTLRADDRTILLKNGSAIFVLFDLSQHEIIDIRENAAKALARLTMDPTNQVQLVSSSAHVIRRKCSSKAMPLLSVPASLE